MAASEDDLDGVEVLPDSFIGVGFVVVDVESFVHGFCVHFVFSFLFNCFGLFLICSFFSYYF